MIAFLLTYKVFGCFKIYIFGVRHIVFIAMMMMVHQQQHHGSPSSFYSLFSFYASSFFSFSYTSPSSCKFSSSSSFCSASPSSWTFSSMSPPSFNSPTSSSTFNVSPTTPYVLAHGPPPPPPFDQHQEHDMGHHVTIAIFTPMHLSPLPPQHLY